MTADPPPEDGATVGRYRWRAQAEMARSLVAAGGVDSRVCRVDGDFALVVADIDVTAARHALGLTLPGGSSAAAELDETEDRDGRPVELVVAATIALVTAVALLAVLAV